MIEGQCSANAFNLHFTQAERLTIFVGLIHVDAHISPLGINSNNFGIIFGKFLGKISDAFPVLVVIADLDNTA